MALDPIAAEDLQEVIACLDSNDSRIAQEAANVIFVMSGGEATAEQLEASGSQQLCEALVRKLRHPDAEMRSIAIRASTNLAQREGFALSFIKAGALGEATSRLVMTDAFSSEEETALLLLNLSAPLPGSEALVADTHWQTLLQQLTTPDQEARCTLDELSAVLPNVARLKSARVQLLDSTGFSQCILTAFANNSMPRKEGYVKALRNCLLKMKEDTTESLLETLRCTISTILHALCDDSRQSSEATSLRPMRPMMAEIILLVADLKSGQRLLWDIGAPELLRKRYEFEEDEVVCEVMEAIAEIFLSAAGADDTAKASH